MFYGEYNTDKIIREKYFPDHNYKGTFIEIGAAKPDYLSLSKHFKESGWITIGIDANPEFAEMHRKVGNRIIECAVADYCRDGVDFTILRASDKADYCGGKVTMEASSALKPYPHVENDLKNSGMYKGKEIIKVRVRTLDKLFEDEMTDITGVDIMSVDLEGGELDALRGFTRKNLYPKLFVIECPYGNRNNEESKVLSGMGYNRVLIHECNHFFTKIS